MILYLFILITFFNLHVIEFLLSILQEKLHKMNDIIKEVRELSNTNNINTKYKMQSHIAHKFIIVLDYYNAKYFIQHLVQVIRYIFNNFIVINY